MMRELPSEPDGGQGRHEAQRQALSGLMARFTADRDALIGAVRECEDRLAAMEARLERGGAAVPRSAAVVREAAEPAHADVRRMFDELREDCRQGLARLQITAESAIQRADEALRWAEKLSGAGPPVVLESADGSGVQAALDELREDLARLEAAIVERHHGSHAVDETPEWQDAVADLIGRVGGVEADVAMLRGQAVAAEAEPRVVAAPVDEGGAGTQVPVLLLDDLRAQVAALQAASSSASGLNRVWSLLLASVLAMAFCGFAIMMR